MLCTHCVCRLAITRHSGFCMNRHALESLLDPTVAAEADQPGRLAASPNYSPWGNWHVWCDLGVFLWMKDKALDVLTDMCSGEVCSGSHEQH